MSQSHPNLAADWDAERNGHLTPLDVAAFSKRRVWWKCPNGHEYEVSVYTRVRTGGCKVCGRPAHGEKIRRAKLAKGRSVSEARPDLLAQWNYERNDLGPDELSEKSHKLMWWRCDCGHEWQSTPQRRARGGCPACAQAAAGDRVRASRLRAAGQSLADAHPDLLREWDYDANDREPTGLTPKSNYRARWRCRYGHEWEAVVVNRTHNLSGCPFCTTQTSRLEIFLLCELRSIFPIVDWRRKFEGIECDIFVPKQSMAVEVDGEYWHKKRTEADERKTTLLETQGITLIRVRDRRLPSVSGNVVRFSPSQELIDVSLALADAMCRLRASDGLRQYLTEGRPRNEQEFRAMLARLPAPPASETLADRHPEVAAEWDYESNAPLVPELFSPGSDQKVTWMCPQGHRWQATIKNRSKNGSGCPECDRVGAPQRTRHWLAAKIGSLETAGPPYLVMWDHEKNGDLSPSALASTSGHRVWWRCPEAHGFQKSPKQMAGNPACPRCSSLAVRFPEIAAEWDYDRNPGMTPERVTPGSSKRAWWRCSVGHQWQAVVSMRASGTGCPVCFEQRRCLDPGLAAARRAGKSLSEINPAWLAEWDRVLNTDVRPEEVLIGSRTSYWWRCLAGHSYQQSVDQRARGRDCPACANASRAEAVRKSKLAHRGSLYANDPEIAAGWHPSKNGDLTPHDISSNSHRRVWWQCPFGHEWEQSPNYRVTLRKRGSSFSCPICARHDG